MGNPAEQYIYICIRSWLRKWRSVRSLSNILNIVKYTNVDHTLAEVDAKHKL